GLQLSPAGVLSGTPTAPSPTTTFTTQVQDSASPSQITSIVLSLHVATPLSVGTLTLPDARTGSPYLQTLTSSGGTGTVTWAVVSGALPPGLSLSTGGVVSGIPTTVNILGSTFTIQATDSGSPSQSAPRTLTLRVAAPLVITTASLPGAKYNVAYTQTLSATGGIAPLKWSLAAGSGPLPTGLTLSAAGILSGTPTANGTFPFTVQVADVGTPQQVATKSFSITVANAYNLSFYVQPTSTYVTRDIDPDIKVRVTDAQGKAISGAKVTLSIAVNPGSAVLSGTLTATTGYDGVATFEYILVSKPGVGYKLLASTNLAGSGTAISNAFNVK
ncbi:MAG: Ig family protein, partial [Candidatus Angelobacter sp.]|nr:Ig family protein [Candidatus Angelobacter sp.]